MTFLVERLAELRRQLDHRSAVRPRVSASESLQRDFSLRNDVRFPLLSICQLVIGIAGELAARRGDRFENYPEAVRTLASDQRFTAHLVRRLECLPGSCNVIVHEYVALDLGRVVQALDELDDVREFARIVAGIERGSPDPSR